MYNELKSKIIPEFPDLSLIFPVPSPKVLIKKNIDRFQKLEWSADKERGLIISNLLWINPIYPVLWYNKKNFFFLIKIFLSEKGY